MPITDNLVDVPWRSASLTLLILRTKLRFANAPELIRSLAGFIHAPQAEILRLDNTGPGTWERGAAIRFASADSIREIQEKHTDILDQFEHWSLYQSVRSWPGAVEKAGHTAYTDFFEDGGQWFSHYFLRADPSNPRHTRAVDAISTDPEYDPQSDIRQACKKTHWFDDGYVVTHFGDKAAKAAASTHARHLHTVNGWAILDHQGNATGCHPAASRLWVPFSP